MKSPKHIFIIAGILISALIVVLVVLEFRSWRTQADVERQFSEIKPLPDAVEVQHNNIRRDIRGGVSGYYKTDLSYQDIRAYYDGELSKRGWKFQKETGIKVWGEDLGGLQTLYCKGNVAATLDYRGREESRVGYRYAFGLYWGNDECK